MSRSEKQAGFALLISLLVVGVVISIGLAILDLSIKQVRLSSNAKESELAFHAANAGMECARYWRREESDDIENGRDITPDCFAGTLESNTVTDITNSNSNDPGDARVFQYQYEFTWGEGTETRCTRINMIVASSSPSGSGVEITDMDDLLSGYTGASDTKICEAGSRCSTISVQGYNLPCSNTGGFGVVQREVLLEF